MINSSINKFFLTIIIFFLSCQTFLGQNLVVRYEFDGNYQDSATSNNDLVDYSSGTNIDFDSGITGASSDSSVLFLNGKGLKSSIAINNVGWTCVSISVWIKNCVDGTIFQGAYFGGGFHARPDGKVEIYFDGSSAGSLVNTNNVDLNDGNWHHIVAQNNGNTTFYYIDNQLDTSFSESLFTLTTPNPNAYIYLGISRIQIGNLEGQLDKFKLYDCILSATEIADLYNEGFVGISEHNELIHFTLSPNPIMDKLNISLKEKVDNSYLISIKNISGQLIKQIRPDYQNITIDLKEYAAGLYFVTVSNNKGSSTHKVVKE